MIQTHALFCAGKAKLDSRMLDCADLFKSSQRVVFQILSISRTRGWPPGQGINTDVLEVS